ncbi:RNA dependent RNA polymerase [Paenibacillus pini]
MDKQVQIYSVDTNDFYTGREIKINKVMNRGYYLRKKIKAKLKKNDHTSKRISSVNRRLSILKKELYKEFKKNEGITRTLNPILLNKNKEISVFDSVLTRTLKMKLSNKENINYINDEIIVVQTYYFDVFKSIIDSGFYFNNNKYICFTASAGQIRTKKTVFIKEELFDKHKESLLCGLTPNKINELGGVNINKYLAYLALCNSATDTWNFNINKSIVVDDMELSFSSEVDYINDNTFEITRCIKEIEINHTDGCGMILPRLSKKNFMIRMPWVKGLLVSFPFDKFIRENHGNTKVKDIYGNVHDIIEEDIQVIFTKSQFKMWKYYRDWDNYIELFKKNNCQIGRCNEEEDNFVDKRINYQMLQTLTDFTNEEVEKVTNQTNQKIKLMSSDRVTMLDMFGVRKGRKTMNNFQKSLSIYPELLEDTYTKHSLKQIKKKATKEGKAGKLDIDCKYSFVCPDLYAFCEYLFLDNKSPSGLLNSGEVSFTEYEDGIELDCLRSPHLYREHAIRKNFHNQKTKEWFVTKGIYTSIHDPISKILMFDNDGDTLLVVRDQTIVQAAKRNMKGIVPLYYEMKKADNHKIDSNMIYDGLVSAYTGGNIGVISNDITKVWNSENINLDVIKWECMLNNFTIDYAKTLYKPTIPKEHKKTISSYVKNKVPHFFLYAKDKERDKVENVNGSTMNRISKSIVNKRMNFRKINVEPFDYKMLMSNPNTEAITKISEYYTLLDQENAVRGVKTVKLGYSGDIVSEYIEIRSKIEKRFSREFNIQEIVDSLVVYLFREKDSQYKTTFWRSFGDIVYENIANNLSKRDLDNTIPCIICGFRIEKKSNRAAYCGSCWKEKQRELKREWKRKHDKNKKK